RGPPARGTDPRRTIPSEPAVQPGDGPHDTEPITIEYRSTHVSEHHDRHDSRAEVSATSRRLAEIIDAEWSWRDAEFGSLSQRPSVVDFLPDVSEEAQLRRRQMWEKTISELDALDTDELSAEEKVDV